MKRMFPPMEVHWYDVAMAAVLFVASLWSHHALSAEPGEITFTHTTQTVAGGQVVVSLSWNTVPRASGCEASGNWSGSRSASRSTPLVLPAATPPLTFGLLCRWPDRDARLTWVAPTQRSDGSALTNLAGYRIFYGAAPSSMTQTIQIADPSILQRLVDGLDVGNWYFNMLAYDADGVESERSATVNIALVSVSASKSIEVRVSAPNAPSGLAVTED